MTLFEKTYWVYILASRRNGTLYVGVTNNLARRAWEHREGIVKGFTKQYGVKLLVYYESYRDVRDAIQREKNIKHWPRRWKLDLIEGMNPEWRDLYEGVGVSGADGLDGRVKPGHDNGKPDDKT